MSRMSRKIRVLQFLSSADIGGTERMVLELVTRMNPQRFATDICFLYGPGPVGTELSRRGFKVTYFRFHPAKLPLVIARLTAFFRRNPYDVIHIYGYKANLLVRTLCWCWGPRHIVTGQRSTDQNRRWFHSWLDRLTSRRVTLYISNSAAAKKLLVEREKIPEEKIVVIPNGVDCQRFRPPTPEEKAALRSWLGLPAGATVTVSVANLLPVKGHIYLLKAIASLPSEIKEKLVLLLVGYGPLQESLQKEAALLNLHSVVRFLGRQESENVAKILRAADIFILASLWEGLPNAVLEAMATGLSVIATATGGVPELIRDEKEGVLVPPKDPDALAAAIRRLVEDARLRQTLGGNARARAQNDFSLEEMTARTEKIYLSLFGGKEPIST